MEVIDNINRLLGDDLKQRVAQGSKLKIGATFFLIFVFEVLKAEMERVYDYEGNKKDRDKRESLYSQSEEEVLICSGWCAHF